jgi:hypothetical protein
MLYTETDRDLITAVSQALGESRATIRDRGFHVIEIVFVDGGDPLTGREAQSAGADAGDSDAVDMTAVAGLDWDAHDDSRLHRRFRRRRGRRVA